MEGESVLGPGKVVGALLAGGKSSRMGRHKAGAPWVGGLRLADAALEALEIVCDAVVVLGHGDGLEHRPELLRIADMRMDSGPLAGLEALLASGLADRYLVCPCDMPFVSESLLQALLREEGAATIVRRADDRTAPFPLAVRSSLAPALGSYLAQGGRSVHGFLDTVAKTTVSAISDPERALLNVNSPTDLEAAMFVAAQSNAVVRTGWDLDAADPAMVDFALSKWAGGQVSSRAEAVPVEAPLLLQVAGRRSQLIMRTPGNDDALILGRLLAEGSIDKRSDIEIFRSEAAASPAEPDQIWVRQSLGPSGLADQRPPDWSKQADLCPPEWSTGDSTRELGTAAAMSRALSGGSKLADSLQVAPDVLARLPERMRQAKGLLGGKRGMHSAALFDANGRLLMLREDVGRHNAIDKVLGQAMKQDQLPLRGHILLVSGRISYAMASKALAASIPVMATLSTPTSMAVRLAEAVDMTLLAFTRAGRFKFYGARSRVRAHEADP